MKYRHWSTPYPSRIRPFIFFLLCINNKQAKKKHTTQHSAVARSSGRLIVASFLYKKRREYNIVYKTRYVHGELKRNPPFYSINYQLNYFLSQSKTNCSQWEHIYSSVTQAMPNNGLGVHKNEECTKAFHVCAIQQTYLRSGDEGLARLSLVTLTGRTIKRMWKKKDFGIIIYLGTHGRQPWRLFVDFK